MPRSAWFQVVEPLGIQPGNSSESSVLTESILQLWVNEEFQLVGPVTRYPIGPFRFDHGAETKTILPSRLDVFGRSRGKDAGGE